MTDIKKNIADILLLSQRFDVSVYNDSFFNHSLQKRITETRSDSIIEYCELLEKSIQEAEIFVNSLNISYSDFFRNSLTFSVLERIILPAIVFSKKNINQKEIRIWSAACAGGQEAYSIAILLEEMKNGDNDRVKYRIFATDRSEFQISEAQKGLYPRSALENMTLRRFKRWFNNKRYSCTVKPELKANIDFSVFNLLEGEGGSPPASIFGDFDLVICSNLLFYYREEFRKVIIEKTTHSLKNGGYLVTGEAEREIFKNSNFREIYPQSAIFKSIGN